MRWFSYPYVPAMAGALFLVPWIGCAPEVDTSDAGNPAPVDAGNGNNDAGAPVDSGPAPDAGTPPPPPPPPTCGNSVVESGEDCDDGNQSQTDACKNNCRFNVCGDGLVYANLEQCDDGNTNNGDGCSAVCLTEPPPLPTSVRLSGQIMDRAYPTPTYMDQVKVKALIGQAYECDGNPECTSGPSSLPNGDYVLPGLPAQSAVTLELRFQQAETFGPANRMSPLVATRVKASTYANAQETKNLYHVKYSWLARVAYECGVYGDIDNVYDMNNYPDAALGHPNWTVYSSTFGQLKDGDGNGVAGIHKDRLEVDLDGYLNDTATRNPNYFCWLEPYDHDNDANTPDQYRGTTSDVSVAAGGAAFVVLHSRNNGNATGSGTQYVRVKYQANGLNFTEQATAIQAGMISIVSLVTDSAVPPPPPIVDLVDFNTQIYPTFTTYGCTSCHSPTGPGAILDLSAQPEDVFNNLMAPSTLCGPGADPTNPRDPNPPAYRVCVDYPKRAKIAIMPLLEDPANHPNASFADNNDPTLRLYEAWMEQGAPRYAIPREPLLEEVPLSSVMNVARDIGCTACHGSAYPPLGGISLDGCVANLDTNGDQINDYEAANIDINPETNPNYKEDCVYYHLRLEPVDNDPYGYRVNPSSPDDSMLLRYPYCGPAAESVDPSCAGVDHPVRLLFSKEEGNYPFFRSYIESLNEPGPVVDAGLPGNDGGPYDAGPYDAGSDDAGPYDAGPSDAGL